MLEMPRACSTDRLLQQGVSFQPDLAGYLYPTGGLRRLQDHDQLHVHEGEVKESPGALQARSIARPCAPGL